MTQKLEKGVVHDGWAFKLSPEDEGYHPNSDHTWHNEGSWFGFFVPERNIDVWCYNLTRRNLGIVAGGVWAWDHVSSEPCEALYYSNYHGLPFDPSSDLRNIIFPSGLKVETLEPLKKHRLRYSDAGLIDIDVIFEGITDPWVTPTTDDSGRFMRYEQPCHVTGEMAIRGERMTIDCYSFRDHSWSIRPERRPQFRVGRRWSLPPQELGNGQVPNAYMFGTASARDAFFVSGIGPSAYRIKDGVRCPMPPVWQTTERSDESGLLTKVTLAGTDTLGRPFKAMGECASVMSFLMPGGQGVLNNHLFKWSFDGTTGWGEVQEMWPLDGWSDFRRWQRTQNNK